MDGSPLPAELAAFQGVDLGDMFSPHDVTFDPSPYIRALILGFTQAWRPEA
jgi:hypothetical protein